MSREVGLTFTEDAPTVASVCPACDAWQIEHANPASFAELEAAADAVREHAAECAPLRELAAEKGVTL